MDRNRLLITGISVAVFLMAVLAVGMVWFYPKAEPEEAKEPKELMGSAEFDPFSYIDGKSEQESGEKDDEAELDLNIRSKDAVPADQSSEQQATEITEDGITIVFGSRDSEQQPEKSTKQQAPYPQSEQEARSEIDSSAEPAEPETDSSAASEIERKSTAQAEPASTGESKSASQSTARDAKSQRRASEEYWIQVFSGTSRSNAQEVRTQFIDKTSMRPLITSVDHKGDTFYRLRVGPYHARKDAEGLLGRITSVDGFSKAYISVVFN